MKKLNWLIVSAIVIFGAALVSAQEQPQMKQDDVKECQGMECGKKMGHKMMMCPMMKVMMEKKVVETKDGGIVVLMGNKLTKYDKNLNYVREVQLNFDMEGMSKMMQDMISHCPMMQHEEKEEQEKQGEMQ